jgi:methionyl-tRNA formyltransferase
MSSHTNLRIVFAGTPDFAVPALKRLLEHGFKPIAVLTQPDRPAGRGRHLTASPVKQAAEAANIPILQPATLAGPEATELISELHPDLLIVVAYGLILPSEILDVPGHGCWNIHASLLPRWRGAAPIQRAIEAGDSETGVCIMQMDEGLDTGPVLHRVNLAIASDETSGSLHDKLAETGAEALLSCVEDLASGSPPESVTQTEQGISYARKLSKAEAQISWQEPARQLEQKIRAFNPWPVAWCDINGERTRIWRATLEKRDHTEEPGTVLVADKAVIEIATGNQTLRLHELQRPGGKRISASEYLNSQSLPGRLDGPVATESL